MHAIRSLFLLTAVAFALTACGGGGGSLWIYTPEDNQIEVKSSVSDGEIRSVANNAPRLWKGSYLGGEEKIPARKALFEQILREESAHQCGSAEAVKPMGEIYFVMKDDTNRNPRIDPVNLGLAGLVLGASSLFADGSESPGTVPVVAQMDYRCTHGPRFLHEEK